MNEIIAAPLAVSLEPNPSAPGQTCLQPSASRERSLNPAGRECPDHRNPVVDCDRPTPSMTTVVAGIALVDSADTAAKDNSNDCADRLTAANSTVTGTSANAARRDRLRSRTWQRGHFGRSFSDLSRCFLDLLAHLGLLDLYWRRETPGSGDVLRYSLRPRHSLWCWRGCSLDRGNYLRPRLGILKGDGARS